MSKDYDAGFQAGAKALRDELKDKLALFGFEKVTIGGKETILTTKHIDDLVDGIYSDVCKGDS